MSELTVHIGSMVEVSNEPLRASGIATRYSFELRWEAAQDPLGGEWEIEIPPDQAEAEEPLFELVTGDDMRAFSRAVNQELQRTHKR